MECIYIHFFFFQWSKSLSDITSTTALNKHMIRHPVQWQCSLVMFAGNSPNRVAEVASKQINASLLREAPK